VFLSGKKRICIYLNEHGLKGLKNKVINHYLFLQNIIHRSDGILIIIPVHNL
jgi:hypothetical protein